MNDIIGLAISMGLLVAITVAIVVAVRRYTPREIKIVCYKAEIYVRFPPMSFSRRRDALTVIHANGFTPLHYDKDAKAWVCDCAEELKPFFNGDFDEDIHEFVNNANAMAQLRRENPQLHSLLKKFEIS